MVRPVMPAYADHGESVIDTLRPMSEPDTSLTTARSVGSMPLSATPKRRDNRSEPAIGSSPDEEGAASKVGGGICYIISLCRLDARLARHGQALSPGCVTKAASKINRLDKHLQCRGGTNASATTRTRMQAGP